MRTVGTPDNNSQDDEFVVVCSENGESVLLEVRGALDLATKPAFENFVAGLSRDRRDVIVDVSRTTFMDSSGLGSLLRVHRTLARDGRRVTVLTNRPNDLRTFAITGLDRVLNVRLVAD